MLFAKRNKPFNITKTKLGYALDSNFISTVVDSCFVKNEYIPSNFEPMFLIYLSQYFTDFKLITKKDNSNSVDFDASLEVLGNSNLVDELYVKCGEDYIENLRANAIELLEFEKTKFENPFTYLVEKLNGILDNFSFVSNPDNSKELLNMVQKLNSMDESKILDKIVQYVKNGEGDSSQAGAVG